ncbi:MAG TPA: hypothetical protein VLV89_07865 [Candidatus Acidoferrum sp.]|nr:hypothetical protein [Candidatus Acidoferrum sp.]
MLETLTTAGYSQVVIEIGGLPLRLSADDPAFINLLNNRYAGFIANTHKPYFEFQIDLAPPGLISTDNDEDVRVRWNSGKWFFDRGDFHAEWDPRARRGKVFQTANPFSIDCVLRIVHTLLLANEGGFLLHAAGAVRNGRAFIFSGVSGAGKTTIAGLAPPDVSLLTDEISYVVKNSDQYFAYGTPFAGELARIGENFRAPMAEVFLLAQGSENKIEPLDASTAARMLLRNTLFFAEDPGLVNAVFQSVCEFVRQIPVRRLTFLPDAKVWELIQ